MVTRLSLEQESLGSIPSSAAIVLSRIEGFQISLNLCM